MKPALAVLPGDVGRVDRGPRGMPHGPWTSRDGCEMFEARHRG